MVYLYYMSILRYTILVGNPRYEELLFYLFKNFRQSRWVHSITHISPISIADWQPICLNRDLSRCNDATNDDDDDEDYDSDDDRQYKMSNIMVTV